MDLDRDDLAVLCQGMSRDEVDRVHRLLRDWDAGPDSSFPVQLALLTAAQLRAAASVPRSIAQGRQWLDQHLAEYRRQAKLLVDSFSNDMRGQVEELKTIPDEHAENLQAALSHIKFKLAEADRVAGQVKASIEKGVSEWERIKASTAAQCEELRQVCDDLQHRFAWQGVLEKAMWFLLVLGIGILAGHYAWLR